MSGSLPLYLLPVLLCLSGFFSASETALFSLNLPDRAWLNERRTGASRCVLELLYAPRTLLVAVLFGNLLVNFLLYATAAHLFTQRAFDGPTMVLAGLLTTGVVIVLGEVVPKSIAVTRPRTVALFTGPPLLLFRNVTRTVGVITPLERLVGLLITFAERKLSQPQGPLTDQELRDFVELEGRAGLIERQSSVLLAEALELRSRRVHEVMTPRVDLIAISADEEFDTFMELVREHRVGKVLVHNGEGLDRIYGYLRTREVLADAEKPLKTRIRPCWYVPTTKSLETLLREMIERNEYVAVVVGEYGGTAGLVTLEDVVEEITGDIAREDADPLLRRLEDDTWRMAGRFPVRDVEELLGVRLTASGATTLSGWVAHHMDRIPEVGDLFWYAGVQFRVDAVERRRATEVRVSLPNDPDLLLVKQIAAGPEASDEMTVSGARRANVRLARWMAETDPEEGSGEEEQRP